MINWFKRKKQKKEKIYNSEEIVSVKVTGVNPQTENEFLFYDFVESENITYLEGWYRKVKSMGMIFKPKYELAIKQRIKTGIFNNPYSFPEYFNNTFDYIAIDFETANQNRVSACAIGLSFSKGEYIVYSTKYYIKPPLKEKFTKRHIAIHGITEKEVEDALTFDKLWETKLAKLLNHGLIIFHNASMDLSILNNLFKFYSINDYWFDYIDTMNLAKKSNNPTRIVELANKFGIEITDHHNPQEDAEICALVFGNLIEEYPDYKSLIKTLSYHHEEKKELNEASKLQISNDNLEIIKKYSITKAELESMTIKGKGFLFTGDINTERYIAKVFIIDNGGIVKSGVTSKVDYVVIGADFGWSKMQKIHTYNTEKNCRIRILTNSDFEYLRKKYNT